MVMTQDREKILPLGNLIKSRHSLYILGIALLVAVADVVLIPFFRCEYFSGAYDRSGMVIIAVFDFCVVFIAGVLGLFFAARIGAAFWWHPSTKSSTSRQVSVNALLLGIAMVAFNTFSIVYNRDQLAQADFWITCLVPRTAVVLSFRAGLNEEVIFRLFLFPVIAWAVARVSRSRDASLITGALVSSFFFGLIHPGFGFITAFLTGLALVYIYYHRGLLPAMIAHFFTDAIPFTLFTLL